MFKEIIDMKALRYLLSMIAVVSVLGVSAQTPRYGTLYKGQGHESVYTVAQMPVASMGSVNTGYVQSYSRLPSAALTGVVTTYDNPAYSPSRPRRITDVNGNGIDDDLETEDDEWGETGDPYATPIGDAAVPLMLLAMAYMAVRIMRKRRGALSK